MADDSDVETLLQNAAQYGVGQGATDAANQAQLAAYDAVLKNLKDRFSDYSNLKTPSYNPITAQKLGPSQLGSIQNDAQSRADEEAAITQLDDIAKSGGLTLADQAALNKIEQTLSRNNAARGNSLRNQYAARGQLGSGAELAMELAGNQNAAMNANERGEATAADAQKRAMQAVLDKANVSRSMSNDDYARKKAAAEANDSIAMHNANFATDAGKYNNSLTGQSYEDQLNKLRGETGLTNSLNTAVLGKGGQQAAGIVSSGNNLGNFIKSVPKIGGGKSSGSSNADTPDAPGTQNTQNFDTNLQPDPSDDPTAGAGDTSWGSLLDDGEAYA